MNKADYKNSLKKYPVSTNALDFMQEQINFVAQLSGITGGNAILKQSTSDVDGLLVLNGELFPLKGSANTYITIQETTEDITARGETFKKARTIRWAQYTSNSLGSNSHKASDFGFIEDLLQQKILNQHHVPKGTVIDWYGEASCDNIPYGWVPCGGFFKTHGGVYQGNGSIPAAITAEQKKWQSRYTNLVSSIDYYYGPDDSYLRITKVGDMDIPNLSGRFIVGAGYSNNTSIGPYLRGEIGGRNLHRLTAAESGLPAHDHAGNVVYSRMKFQESGEWVESNIKNNVLGESTAIASLSIDKCEDKIASVAHENRPPYFAMYKLIKVI